MDNQQITTCDTPKKNGLFKALSGAISSFKGEDLPAKVEQYTNEVTLVIEGLHSDQVQLEDQLQQLSAHMTILEQRQRQIQEQLITLKKGSDKRKTDFHKNLVQFTWIAALLSGAWVITTLLRVFGG